MVESTLESRGFFRGAQTQLLDLQPLVVVKGTDPWTLSRLVIHELAHRLLATCVPSAPPWLHEGVASYFETARIEDGKLRLGFPPYLFANQVDVETVKGLRVAFYEGEPVVVLPKWRAPGLEELLAMSPEVFYDRDLFVHNAHYAGAWMLVHMLQRTDSLQFKFERYLRALRDSVAPEQAWQASFGAIEISTFYQSYVKEGPSSWGLSPMERQPTPRPSVRPMSVAQAAFVQAELLPWDEEDGQSDAQRWLEYAAANGADETRVRTYRGAVCEAGGDSDCARASLERATEGWPSDPDALAAVLRWHASSVGARTSEPSKIESWLAALREQAKSSFHFATLAWWYGKLEDEELALQFAERSIALDRTNAHAHLAAGNCHARLGNYVRALEEYRVALALSQHGGAELSARVQKQILNVEMLAERKRASRSVSSSSGTASTTPR